MNPQPPDDPKNIWQSQGTEHQNMSLQEIRGKVRKLHLRNRMNFVIGIVCTVIFGWTLLRVSSIGDRIGWGLIFLGTLHMTIILARWASGNLPQDAALDASVQFYRSRLRNVRAFPRKWGAGAILFIAGTLIVIGGVMVHSVLQPPPLKNILPFCLLLAAWGVSYIVVRRRRRRWVKHEIERLDLLEKENR